MTRDIENGLRRVHLTCLCDECWQSQVGEIGEEGVWVSFFVREETACKPDRVSRRGRNTGHKYTSDQNR
jgi:hypothetical protein